MKKISDHISYSEAIKSITAVRHNINNQPDTLQLENMIKLAQSVFEPVRNYFKQPIFISSFFRSIELNIMIGGSQTSQHCAYDGAAIDIDSHVFGNLTNKQIFDYIKNNLNFDQLIWEFGNDKECDWVHVSYNQKKNRYQIIKSVKIKGKSKYIQI